jgi:hypothetical protein
LLWRRNRLHRREVATASRLTLDPTTLRGMDGATVVAAIAVVVAGATSVGAPIIAGRNQRRSDDARFRHERAMTDTDELRALIDEIAVALPAAIQKQSTFRSKHSTSGSTDANDYMKEMGAFTQAREKLIFMHARLLLRLTREHPVTLACGKAIELIDAAGGEVLGLVTLDQPPPEGSRQRAIDERKAMWAAQQQFLDVASEFVSAPVRSLT